MVVDTFADLFQQNEEFVDHTSNPHFEGDDLFSIFESLESVAEFTMIEDDIEPAKDGEETTSLVFSETELETSPKTKRLKTTTAATSPTAAMAGGLSSSEDPNTDGPQRMSHITVERNRRKQMNEHLTVLRSLMPCFYVKKGDQASIIGGVVEYIKELQQVLQSLEAKKQRKVYSEVLSPRVVSSPRPNLPMSPRKPPLSPRLNLPISPRTPQPSSPYSKPPPRLQQPPSAVAAAAATGGGSGGYNISSSSSCTNNMANNNNSLEPSPCNSCSTTNSSIDNINNNSNNNNNNNGKNNDLVANSKSAIAEVEVKFTGPNVVLKTVSPPIPGQAVKIISALEQLSLEILHVKITTLDDTMFNSFTIKIGIECELSAEELAHQIQQTFC